MNIQMTNYNTLPKEESKLSDSDDVSANALHRVHHNIKLEITDLCYMFFGNWGKVSYTIVASLYLYGALIVYATIFANTLASQIPIYAGWDYCIYLAVFSVFAVVFSCMEMDEQEVFQKILTLCRIAMILLMLLTVGSAMYACDYDSKCQQFGDYVYDPSVLVPGDLKYIYNLLPVIAYANVFHHSIPALSYPVMDKSTLHSIFIFCLSVCLVSYSFVSVTLSSYFKNTLTDQVNLNWLHYTGGISKTGHPYASLGITAITWFIVLFPALDVSSAFPLNAITLGECVEWFGLYTSVVYIMYFRRKFAQLSEKHYRN